MSYMIDTIRRRKIDRFCDEIKNCPQFINSVTVPSQSVEPGATVIFTNDLVRVGDSIVHVANAGEFNIICPGKYLVTFTSSVSSPLVDTGINLSVGIALNGSVIPGTTVSEYITLVEGNTASLFTQAVIDASPFIDSIVTMLNQSDSIQVFTNANIIIQKID
jgi:hypothetical protein